MARVIRQVEYDIEGPDGRRYWPRVVGERDGHLWEGLVEFVPVRDGDVLVAYRETSQSKREDLEYWASGLEATFFEGALERAYRAAHPETQIKVPAVSDSTLLGRLTTRAALLAQAGDLTRAINAARRVLGASPYDPDALWILAVCHAERGDRTAAKSSVSDFLTYAPIEDPRRPEAEILHAEVEEAIARAAGM